VVSLIRNLANLLIIDARFLGTYRMLFGNKLADLTESKFALAQNVKMKESKWTHHHLETVAFI